MLEAGQLIKKRVLVSCGGKEFKQHGGSSDRGPPGDIILQPGTL